MAPAEVAPAAAEPPLKKLKRKLPALPVSSKILGALTDLQKDVAPTKREARIQTIVHSMQAGTGAIDSEANQYLLKRLVNGVASSAGASRANYAAVLARVARAHACGVGELYAAVVAVYGDGGTFDAGYARGRIDRTLGALVATAAVVRGARGAGKPIPPDNARAMLLTLRRAVVGDAQKWGLGPAVIKVVRELLDAVRDGLQPLKKVLWRWAEDRKLAHDGITLALLLQMEYQLIPDTAMKLMYRNVDQMATALMAMFNTGFPRPDPAPSAAWEWALKYSATEKGVAHVGGVAAFWDRVVAPNLIDGVANLEKNLLLRKLLPLALRLVGVEERVELILTRATIMKLGAGMFVALARRKRKLSPSEQAWNKKYLALEAELPTKLAAICGDKELDVARRVWVAEMLIRWVCGNSQYSTGSENIIKDIPQAVDAEVAKELFGRILYMFLVPDRVPRHDVERLRMGYFSVLERIVAAHPHLSDCFTQAVVMGSVFVDGKSQAADALLPETLDEKTVKLTPISEVALKSMKQFEKDVEEGKGGSALPCPQPLLSETFARKVYGRFMEVLLKGVNRSTAVERLRKATEVIRKLVDNMEPSGLKSRGDVGKVKSMCEAVDRLAKCEDAESSAVKCLELIGHFLCVSICDLSMKGMDGMENISEKFVGAVDAFCGGNEGNTEDAPNAMEQTTHLLCVMCGGDERFGIVAKLGADLLGECGDDAVTAVLFDMLEMAKKGEVEEEEEEEESDDDVEMVNGEVEIVDVGDADSGDVDEEDGDEDVVMMINNALQNEVDSESEDDMDPDEEDPEMLARVDAHLSNHMKLLEEKRKAARKERVRANEKVVRLLTIVQTVANGIRLRVEKKNVEVEKKLVVVYFDMFVRVVELGFENSKHGKHVQEICEKLMCKRALFVTHLTGVELVAEFGDRLVAAVSSKKSLGVMASVVRRLLTVVKDVLEAKKGKKHRKQAKEIEELVKKLEAK